MSERAYSINNPDGIYFVTFSVVNWIDIFVRQRYKDIIVDSLKYCQENKGLEIFGFHTSKLTLSVLFLSKI
jgi:hypothetical protein